MGKDPEIDLTQTLREFALERLDVDLMGVAPAERLEDGPEGGRPTDYMPTARSVVVLAAKIPDAAVEVAGHYDEPGKTLGPYMWYGYVVPNWDLSSAASRLAKFLESRGYQGASLPAHRPQLQIWKPSRLFPSTCGDSRRPWRTRLQRPGTHPAVRTKTETGLDRHGCASRALAHVRRAQALPAGVLRTSVRQGLPHQGNDRTSIAHHRRKDFPTGAAAPHQMQVAVRRGRLPQDQGRDPARPHGRGLPGRTELDETSPARHGFESVHVRPAMRGLHLSVSGAAVRGLRRVTPVRRSGAAGPR